MSFKTTFYQKTALAIAIFVLCVFLSLPALSQTGKQGPIPAKGMPTILDLGATACVPCKMMAPILEKLEKEYRGEAAVIFVDVWKDANQARRFGIRTIPTQIFFDKNGDEVTRHEGFLGEASIIHMLTMLGARSDKVVSEPASPRSRELENWFSANPIFTTVTSLSIVFLIISGWLFIRLKKNRQKG